MLRIVLLLTSFFVINPTLQAQTINNPCDGRQCIAIVDAGSTGSRLNLYVYDEDQNHSPINLTKFWSKKIKPGLATIESNKNTIDAYLTTLLADAPVKEMPIYFYATAGMRLLSAQKQATYYQEIQQWFAQQDQWKLISAKTITGNQEALFDWLSVNYNLGNLKADGEQSIGVMDMGGASVQIAFPIQQKQATDNSQVEVDLYGKHYVISVHSFLGLGQTEMSHQFLNASACFTTNYPLPDGELGAGDTQTCEAQISSLLNGVHGVNKAIQPLLSENSVDSWYTIGGISNLVSSKPFNFENHQLTLNKLLEEADSEVCHKHWDALSGQFPSDEYLYQYCLASSYYYALIVDGYGLQPNKTINYVPPEQNIDWTTGVILHH